MKNIHVMEELKDFLKETIDSEGIDYLQREPFEIYKTVTTQANIDSRYARMLLITLLCNIPDQARGKDADESAISEYLQKESFLKKSIADEFAAMYLSLFSVSNMRGWKEKEALGLREFCNNEWTFKWDGSTEWDAGNVYMDCTCHVEIVITVCDTGKLESKMQKILEKNPFVLAKDIFKEVSKQLSKKIEEDFTYYVEADDYYPPVMEDYSINCEDVVERFCDEFGLEIISFDYDGDNSDYEPK